MGTREIVRLLWPSDCQLRHVSVSYLRETLQACTSTATRQNAKLHTRTCTRSPRLFGLTFHWASSINIFHCWMVYDFYVWNSLQIAGILIFWSDDYNGWKTWTADAGDISPLSTLSPDKLLCNPDLIFFQQFPNLISLSQGAVHEISVYFAESVKYF